MSQHPGATVFVVDDDTGVRDALAWLLRTRRLLCEGFASGETFLAEINAWHQEPQRPGCVLLDLRMSGMSSVSPHPLALLRGLRLGRGAFPAPAPVATRLFCGPKTWSTRR
ncbi:MAG: response regulator [Hydrogenophaga sp.]|nr:response regulator [Hydrogenophaga sp.]